MASVDIVATAVHGLVPALDRRQLPKISVMTGKNICINAQGPYSGYGTIFATYSKFSDPDRVQSFRIGTDTFHFLPGVVLTYDETSQSFIPVYTMSSDTDEFPWSHALVGGIHYFAKQGITGILQYNPTTVKWQTITSNVPTGAVAVTQSAGRLVILGTSTVGWSAISNGVDLATSTVTGAGQQALSLINEGAPLGIYQTDDGFISYTTGGLLKSEVIDSVNPFRHFALSGKIHIPLSAYCISVVADDTSSNRHIILARSGLWQTTGDTPVRWEAQMSEYFTNIYLPTLGSESLASIGALIRMTYVPDLQWFVISLSLSPKSFDYNEAYVLYLPKSGDGDGWGHFDETHSGIVEFYSDRGINTGFVWAYVGIDGSINLFSDNPVRETDPDYAAVDGIHHRIEYEIPARYDGTTAIFATVGRIRSYDITTYPNTSGIYFINAGTSATTYISPDPVTAAVVDSSGEDATGEDWLLGSGTEDWNADTGTEDWLTGSMNITFVTYGALGAGFVQQSIETMLQVFGSINASMEVGLYRITDQQFPDQLSLINDVTLGVPSSPGGQTTEDWLTDVLPAEDWNTGSGAEDWGFGVINTSTFVATILGTLDGESVWNNQNEILTLVTDDGKFKHFTCSNTALYHTIKLDALNVNESFYLKTLEVSGALAGRL